MNFFKAVFSADPDPPQQPLDPDSDEYQQRSPDPDPQSPSNTLPAGSGTTWGFGGLLKTLATKSESVIQTYRRDLEEFGSGFKKETAAIREAATRAVLDLPVSLEAGASVAQESLESVGQVIDELGDSVWRGTAEIISQGKDVLLSMDNDAETSDASALPNSGASKRFSRFEAQVLGMQGEQSTYLEEPEDGEEFMVWKEGFVMEDKEEEINETCSDNAVLVGMFDKLVPRVVDYDTFWTRYFYKVYKLKEAEETRVKLVKRVISGEEEEDLTWEVDDDDCDDEEKIEQKKEVTSKEENESKVSEPSSDRETACATSVEAVVMVEEEEEKHPIVVEESHNGGEVKLEEKAETSREEIEKDSVAISYDRKLPDVKTEAVEPHRDSDVSVVVNQPSMQEEDDLEWDDIEDMEENDKKPVASGGSSNKVDLRKRLSVAEDDGDLSWDIEDD